MQYITLGIRNQAFQQFHFPEYLKNTEGFLLYESEETMSKAN